MTKKVKQPLKPSRIATLMVLIAGVGRKLENLSEQDREFVLNTINEAFKFYPACEHLVPATPFDLPEEETHAEA